MAKNKNGKKVVKAAMFGSLVGGVMGLLFAPKSGKELRLDIAGQANKTEQKAKAIRDKAQSAWQNVENQTQLTLNTGKSWIEKGKLVVSNLKTLVSEIRQGALTKNGSINSSEDEEEDSENSEDLTKEILRH